jgi:GTP-binding protein EngB required for normal cell division
MGQIISKFSRRRAAQILPDLPDYVRFRILIIGRANAGKTSILQRVCDTTESPQIYSFGPRGEREQVRPRL